MLWNNLCSVSLHRKKHNIRSVHEHLLLLGKRINWRPIGDVRLKVRFVAGDGGDGGNGAWKY